MSAQQKLMMERFNGQMDAWKQNEQLRKEIKKLRAQVYMQHKNVKIEKKKEGEEGKASAPISPRNAKTAGG